MTIDDEDYKSLIEERYSLIKERMPGIIEETEKDSFFNRGALFLEKIFPLTEKASYGKLSNDEAMRISRDLYSILDEENYGRTFLNPDYACALYGERGNLYSMLAADLFGLIPGSFGGDIENVVLFSELFISIYDIVNNENTDKALKDEICTFYRDNTEIFMEKDLKARFTGDRNCLDILYKADLRDESYLYRYGLPIGKNEKEIRSFLETLSQNEIDSMAKACVDGYIRGFKITGRDISKKSTVLLYYPIGFERIIRRSAELFKEAGLFAYTSRIPSFSFDKRGKDIMAFSTSWNRQFIFDHQDDFSLYYTKAYAERNKEVYRKAFSDLAKEAAKFSGPAVTSIFGKENFDPDDSGKRIKSDEKTNALHTSYRAILNSIYNEYVKEEETSFTIISYPLPSIGSDFKAIFKETAELNSMDSDTYSRIQQYLIDALDKADYVRVKGKNGNKTDLKIMLHPIKDPDRETKFENCTADVNIPLGEVFTSPVLKGTEGILHVKHVYLSGFFFKDLEIKFEDGMVKNISCRNFSDKESEKRYLNDHIMFHHKTLPLGEFAIGTNTKAYVMARHYGIEDKMDILIAEKTGPHFAVGDTCYSHAEDVKVYNPDGKEIIARENEISAKREEEPLESYFQCHTDITIPYDELESIRAYGKDGEETNIIIDGRFVLPGTLILNKPLEEEEKNE